MLDYLKQVDESLFLFLNSLHNDWLDPVMLFLSAKKVWIPLYLGIVAFIIYSFRKRAIVIIIAIILCISCADQLTSSIMKPGFERTRPCHETHLQELIHKPSKCGGRYGFASSHAANTFGLAVFLAFLFNRKKLIGVIISTWAFLVSYSRIYLGVHYPGDILVGAALGSILAFIFLKAAHYFNNLIFIEDSGY